jgi:Amt family ammonium transporter
MNHGDAAWMLFSSALVFLMTPGLALFYSGMTKRKNTVNTIMTCILTLGLSAVLWVLIGFSLSFSGDVGGVIGNLKWAGMNFNEFKDATFPPNTLIFAIFQMMFAVITPSLIAGAIVERMRFSSFFVFAAVWSVLVYYPMAHMVWGGGFLAQIGSIDFAGGNVVHITSGISALLLSILLGKRKNYGRISYHPHNVPSVFLGAALLWFGWFGFNAGSAGAANELAAHAFLTTNTSAAAAMLSWMLVERLTNGSTTLVGASTGLVVGLVAITPGSGFVPIWAALVIGALASPISYGFISVVKSKLGYDDALDVFGCHGIGGIWGGIATGLFTQKAINPSAKWNGLLFGNSELFLRQLAAIGVAAAVAIVGTLIAAGVARLVTGRLRVGAKDEELGLDITEHGEPAYPAFNGMD